LGIKGISQPLFEERFCSHSLHLSTRLRKTMKNGLVPLVDKVVTRKRAVIESITEQLKNTSQIEHSRHRSPTNFLVNLIGGVIAYCFQPLISAG
jgi:Transposase DDE domain